jgi:hypothetical protein
VKRETVQVFYFWAENSVENEAFNNNSNSSNNNNNSHNFDNNMSTPCPRMDEDFLMECPIKTFLTITVQKFHGSGIEKNLHSTKLSGIFLES